MRQTCTIAIRTLSDKDLELYAPENRYWMLRSLWCEKANQDDKPSLVVIRIEFHNESDDSIELSFNNAACKAELLSLEVNDESGARVEPLRNIHAKLRSNSHSPHIVPSHEKYVYDLVGEVVDNWLVFPGAKYSIPQNRLLRFVFKYEGITSNVAQLHL
jgi:hypothetical protein